MRLLYSVILLSSLFAPVALADCSDPAVEKEMKKFIRDEGKIKGLCRQSAKAPLAKDKEFCTDKSMSTCECSYTKISIAAKAYLEERKEVCAATNSIGAAGCGSEANSETCLRKQAANMESSAGMQDGAAGTAENFADVIEEGKKGPQDTKKKVQRDLAQISGLTQEQKRGPTPGSR